MLLLTVTTETQGRRSTDSCSAIDGELVFLAQTSDCDQYEPTSPWPRSFQGLSSTELTTTAVVRDVPLTDADVRLAVRGYLETHQPSLLAELRDRAGDESCVDALLTEWTDGLTTVAAGFFAGTVVERWWDVISPRGPGPLRRELPPGRRRASW
ncbi:DUF7715 family protein [Pengzhenrongella sicca]|uniref:DUF7715 domain-containing protein n=1 Tax=Pengzhenrongella sicca TaxID=2819238 RepID=A0A8A4ZCX9_9MICO|nr:hypothetical protein [Pengzhenrongella sicca]QTE29764.1 hypothetical protein J4E96_01580 [Pengzhenrongella sicca]